MKDIKISIIIPIYNSEASLQRCIESVINQTFSNWELILINDGSTDNSATICNKYRNNKIKIINKKNEGVSVARNIGLEHATGTYITFADSDDYLEPYTFQTYVDEIKRNQPNIIKVGYFKEMWNGKQEIISTCVDYNLNNTWDFYRILEKSFYYGFLWNMCIQKECISNIRFEQNINWCEDHIFSYQCYLNCQKMSILSIACYHYQIHKSGSLSDVRNPYIIQIASEKERYWKLKLNSGVYLDIQRAIDNEYLYRLHTIVRLLYEYKSTYKERNYLSKKCTIIPGLKYKEEKIFFFSFVPFIIRDLLLKTYYKAKKLYHYQNQ